MSSTPNRLYKDAKQKENNVLCAFICLWTDCWEMEEEESRAQHKVNKLVFLDVEFSENEKQRGG